MRVLLALLSNSFKIKPQRMHLFAIFILIFLILINGKLSDEIKFILSYEKFIIHVSLKQTQMHK
jgi:hypothetical protein